MRLHKIVVMSLAGCLAVVVACSRSSAPTSPNSSISAMGPAGTSAPFAIGTTTASLADAVTLKVTAPVPVSPLNDAKVQTAPVTLVAGAATGKFATPVGLQYRFLIFGPTGALVQDSGLQSAPSFAVSAALDGDIRYTWVVRAESGGAVGPWSTPAAAFIAPATTGYISGSELYDPLINSKTVGQINGPVTFIPGVGVRMDSVSSYIQYALPQTLREGEYSALITNVGVVSSTEDPKNRIITMREGDAAINDNPYRMSVDVRGNGAIAWRFLSGNPGGGFIETQGAERTVYSFHEALTYFVKATWTGGFFNVEFREGGFSGTTVYSFGKPYSGAYRPSPHNVFAGSPFKGGDRGEPSTVEDMIIRQIWVSSRPRPLSANQ